MAGSLAARPFVGPQGQKADPAQKQVDHRAPRRHADGERTATELEFDICREDGPVVVNRPGVAHGGDHEHVHDVNGQALDGNDNQRHPGHLGQEAVPHAFVIADQGYNGQRD
ncbi:hypothetical protein DESC_660024 [Desulfosarcina cetonica]|nr:hypothetical protein DESC_660024 [Desulfosarcina cetonica]